MAFCKRRTAVNACVASLLVAVLGAQPTWTCTTILVGRGLTADGSILHAHNEDMGNDAAGRVWFVAGAEHASGAVLRVPYVELAQPRQTLQYWASGNVEGGQGLGTAAETLPYDSVLVGLNERGVSMSCNWAHSREENREGVGVRRYAIRQLLLERSTSARHGVEILGEFIETHGQADWGGLIYHLADPEEAWVVETTTRNWVARRVRDDEIWVTANRFRIGTDYDLSSKTLVQHAVEAGWHQPDDGKLEFSGTYGLPEKMHQPYDTRREERASALLSAKAGSLAPADVLQVLRDRYDNTEFYTPPQSTPVWREDLDARPEIARTIATNLTQSTFVAHLRRDAPAGLGAVMWAGVGTPTYAGYVPLYAAGGVLPQEYSAPSKRDELAWQTFRTLQRTADPNYDAIAPSIRSTWASFQDTAFRSTQRVEQKAQLLYDKGKTQAADRLLRKHTRKLGREALTRAQQLLASAGRVAVDHQAR